MRQGDCLLYCRTDSVSYTPSYSRYMSVCTYVVVGNVDFVVFVVKQLLYVQCSHSNDIRHHIHIVSCI